MQRARVSSKVFLGIAVMALVGCTTTPTVDIRTQCLPLVDYALPDQQEFGREVAALDPVKDKQVIRFLGDYHAMRDADKVCIASSH